MERWLTRTRTEGATIAAVIEATGWAPHTVRGFLAGLKKKGHAVEVLERVRQVGPSAAGAKGSYSVYRIVEAADGDAGVRELVCGRAVRVSTAEQGQSGLGMEAQQASVRAVAATQGWTLVEEFSDVASGKDDRRAGFVARSDHAAAHTLSQLLEDGYSVRAAGMPGPTT